MLYLMLYVITGWAFVVWLYRKERKVTGILISRRAPIDFMRVAFMVDEPDDCDA
jgi:hypothetical protein